MSLLSNNPFDRINEATKLFKVSRSSDGSFFGLVSPPSDKSIFQYSKPVLSVDGYFNDVTKLPCITIRSIDDSGVTMWFKKEYDDTILLKFIKLLESNSYICPDKCEIDEFCIKNGGYANYW
jgi:hypothetical protein